VETGDISGDKNHDVILKRGQGNDRCPLVVQSSISLAIFTNRIYIIFSVFSA